jgi:HK97 family phage portal protein
MMNVINKVKSVLGIDKKVLEEIPNNPGAKDIDSVYAGSNDKFKSYIPYFLYKPPYGYPRTDLDYSKVMKLAQSPYVWSVIKAIRDRVRGVDWDIVPKDGEELTDELKAKAKEIKQWFENPNGNHQSWVDVQDALINDVLVFDAGVGVKVFDHNNKFRQLFARSGATFLKNPDIYGYMGDRDEIIDTQIDTNWSMDSSRTRQVYDMRYKEHAAYFQYGWTPGSVPVPFGKREVIYLSLNNRTDSVYGRSPVQILYETILLLIYGGRYNLDMYINNNVPQGIISLLGANAEQIKRFRERLDERMLQQDTFDNWRKKNFRIPVVGGKDIADVKFTPWQVPSKELQILEQQQWYQKIVWQTFGVTPDEMGETGDSNRATSNEQARVLKKRAIKPLLQKLAHAWNSQLMPELDDTGKLCFKYNDYDVEEDYRINEVYEKKLNYMTVNEIRELEGLPPIEDGDKLTSVNQGGYSAFGGFNGDDDSQTNNPNDNKPNNTNENNDDKLDDDDSSNNDSANTKTKKEAEDYDIKYKDLEHNLSGFYKNLEKSILDITKDQL